MHCVFCLCVDVPIYLPIFHARSAIFVASVTPISIVVVCLCALCIRVCRCVRVCACVPAALFALVAQAVWADQSRKHSNSFESSNCGIVNFHYGPSFGLAAVVWVFCVINMIWRAIFRKQFKDVESDASVNTHRL